MSKHSPLRIVIVGAGFGGIATYQKLCSHLRRDVEHVEITIINKTNHFLFTPLLHEVATGALNRFHVTEPLRKLILPHTDVHIATVEHIDFEQREVSLPHTKLLYDYLVLAPGATTQYFNTPGAEEYTQSLKTLRDANTIRDYIVTTFEEATRISDEKKRREKLSFVIVGGGATGVELAAELAEFVYDTLQKYYQRYLSRKDISIKLINSGPELLKQFYPHSRKRARRVLEQKGVTILTEKHVASVSKDGVQLNDGTFISSQSVMWAAGVTPHHISTTPTLQYDKGGRILVNEHLQVIGHTNVFALGDAATSISSEHPHGLPMLAQIAKQQGRIVGHNISRMVGKRPLQKFKFNKQGELVSLGQWHALGTIKGVHFAGFAAWFLWRTIYLFNFASWRKRIKIAVDWTINLFSEREITRVE